MVGTTFTPYCIGSLSHMLDIRGLRNSVFNYGYTRMGDIDPSVLEPAPREIFTAKYDSNLIRPIKAPASLKDGDILLAPAYVCLPACNKMLR